MATGADPAVGAVALTSARTTKVVLEEDPRKVAEVIPKEGLDPMGVATEVVEAVAMAAAAATVAVKANIPG